MSQFKQTVAMEGERLGIMDDKLIKLAGIKNKRRSQSYSKKKDGNLSYVIGRISHKGLRRSDNKLNDLIDSLMKTPQYIELLNHLKNKS